MFNSMTLYISCAMVLITDDHLKLNRYPFLRFCHCYINSYLLHNTTTLDGILEWYVVCSDDNNSICMYIKAILLINLHMYIHTHTMRAHTHTHTHTHTMHAHVHTHNARRHTHTHTKHTQCTRTRTHTHTHTHTQCIHTHTPSPLSVPVSVLF